MKKLEKFWRENAVGIGLCNECVLWWGVRFERLLAALKSKRDEQAQKCIVFGASVRWAFELINASSPGITTYGKPMDLVVDAAALKTRMVVTASDRSLVVSYFYAEF